MLLPDVNILVYCFRTDSPFHEACRTWLEKLAAGGEVLACSRQTLASVVRITTNRRAYREPSNLEEAIGFCNDILAYERCQLIEPGEHFWKIFANLLQTTQTTGPMVTDAWFAALAMEWNCELVSFDRDFARFPKLRWRVPEQP